MCKKERHPCKLGSSHAPRRNINNNHHRRIIIINAEEDNGERVVNLTCAVAGSYVETKPSYLPALATGNLIRTWTLLFELPATKKYRDVHQRLLFNEEDMPRRANLLGKYSILR